MAQTKFVERGKLYKFGWSRCRRGRQLLATEEANAYLPFPHPQKKIPLFWAKYSKILCLGFGEKEKGDSILLPGFLSFLFLCVIINYYYYYYRCQFLIPPSNSMRKLCPNFYREDGLETVLEVPIPEEMLFCVENSTSDLWQNLRSIMKTQSPDKSSHLASSSNNEFMALLKLVGSPLIPVQVQSDQTLLTRPLRDCSIVSIIDSSSFSFVLNYAIYSVRILF